MNSSNEISSTLDSIYSDVRGKLEDFCGIVNYISLPEVKDRGGDKNRWRSNQIFMIFI